MKWRVIQFLGGSLIYLVLRSQLYGSWRTVGDVVYGTGAFLMAFAVVRVSQRKKS